MLIRLVQKQIKIGLHEERFYQVKGSRYGSEFFGSNTYKKSLQTETTTLASGLDSMEPFFMQSYFYLFLNSNCYWPK